MFHIYFAVDNVIETLVSWKKVYWLFINKILPTTSVTRLVGATNFNIKATRA